jgi:hypothetical protein
VSACTGLSQFNQIRLTERREVDAGTAETVVPRDRHRVPFHEFEEALQDGFLEVVARSVAVGIGVTGTRSTLEPIAGVRRWK